MTSNNDGQRPESSNSAGNSNTTPIREILAQEDLNKTENLYAVEKHKLPPFLAELPDIWFILIEAEFNAAKVHSDETKYTAVLRALDATTLRQLTNILCNPPDKNKYQHLKSIILNRVSKSRPKQVDKLLKNLVLSDKKPSQLLQEMRDLAKGEIGDEILHQLWLERLPVHIRPHLLTSNNLGLNAVAEMADRIVDLFNSSYVITTSSSCNQPSSQQQLEKKIDDMQTLLITCIQEIKELKVNDNRQQQSQQQSQCQQVNKHQIYKNMSIHVICIKYKVRDVIKGWTYPGIFPLGETGMDNNDTEVEIKRKVSSIIIKKSIIFTCSLFLILTIGSFRSIGLIPYDELLANINGTYKIDVAKHLGLAHHIVAGTTFILEGLEIFLYDKED